MNNTDLPLDTPKALLEFFSRSESYPHQTSEIRHLETHISHVFLTGDYVYKVKKPVNFGFLDYSTLTKRKSFCEKELTVNRLYAPELYQDVVAVYYEDGAYSFEAKGEPVEYAVRMKQFEQHDIFSELLSDGKLTLSLMDELAREIVRVHRKAERRQDFGRPEDIATFQSHNIETFRGSGFFRVEEVAELVGAFGQELLHNKETIEERRSEMVRFLHGDLHLGNICLYNRAVTLFDGIEFNDSIASCDVWSDLAFLYMDLMFRGKVSLGTRVRSTYLEETDDFAGLTLCPLFVCYRASVRAKVATLRAMEIEDGAEKNKKIEEASKYLTFAMESLKRKPLKMIAIGGFSGSGKTTLARRIAEAHGGVHIRSDVTRKHIFGVPLTERLDSSRYTSEKSDRVYHAMRERAELASQNGGLVILDAVYADREERDAIEELCNEFGGTFSGYWCDCPKDIAEKRINERREDASDATAQVLKHQIEKGVDDLSWAVLDTSQDVNISSLNI